MVSLSLQQPETRTRRDRQGNSLVFCVETAEHTGTVAPAMVGTKCTPTQSDAKPRRRGRASNNNKELNDTDSSRRSNRIASNTQTTDNNNARSRSRSRRNTRLTIKPPSSPKEPISACEFYKLDVLPWLKEKHPNLNKNQLETKVNFKKENSITRSRYMDMEKDDKLRYEIELHQYNSILNDHEAEKVLPAAEQTRGPTGLAPPATAVATTRTVEVSTTVAKPKMRTRGTQTIPLEQQEQPSIQHLWKPSQFKNRNRFKLLEQHRKFRRQKMAARRQGIRFCAKRPSSEEEEDYLVAHSNDWEIEEILGKRSTFAEHEFLVRWKGKDPSWDSWETLGSIQTLSKQKRHNLWEQVRLYANKEKQRKELMERGAKELGLYQWGQTFSLVQDLEELPHPPQWMVAASSQEAPAPHQPGLAVGPATVVPASTSDEKEATNSVAAQEVKQACETPGLGTTETANVMQGMSKENETTNRSMPAQQAAETTMIELEASPKSSHGEITAVSATAHAPMDMDTSPPQVDTQPEFDTQPDLYTQPEPSVVETTTVSTLTLATGRIPDTVESPVAMETNAPNSAPANSEFATTSDTDTETELTTEPSNATTAEDSPTKPLAANEESEWSQAPEAQKASTTLDTAINETTDKAAVPVTMEANARSSRKIETIVIDDDDETEYDPFHADNTAAEVVTLAKNSSKNEKWTSIANNVQTTNSTSEDKIESSNHFGSSSMEQSSMKQQQEPVINDADVAEVRGVSEHPKRPTMDGALPKVRKRRRTPPLEDYQCENDSSTLFQVPSANEMNIRDVRRVNVFDIDAKQIVSEARENGHPVVLTNLLGHAQFATRWLKRWNGRNRQACHDEDFDGDVHSHQHEELLDLSQPLELDIVRMIQDIGQESVPILKKNYSEKKPIVKETFAASFLWKCWPRNGQEAPIKGLYLHQWQFPRSETAASKLCGHGSCSTIPNGIVGEDLLQFWLDGNENPYQYIFMGGADTFSRLHKDSGGLDITIAPIVGEKECVMVHRLDESYLYGMKSKLDNADLHKYPMTAHARIWKTIVKPGELLWMPANTFHQCRNVTPCLSYHRFHLDTTNLPLFFNSLFIGDAPEIEHDEVIWNCTIALIERMETFLRDYRRQTPMEPVPEHIAETASTLCYLRPFCREVSIAFDPSCNQIHYRPSNPVFRSNQAFNAECWAQLVRDIDHILHDFNYRTSDEGPSYESQAEKSIPKPPVMDDPKEIQRGLDRLQDSSSSTTKEGSVAGTSALQKLYDKLSAIQPFQEGVVIPDSIQLKSNDKIIFRIGEKQCSGCIVKIEDQLRAVHLAYSRLPSYYDEYMPVDAVVSAEDSVTSSPLRKKQKMVSSAIGGKGKPVKATIQSMKVATFYLVRFSMDAKSAKLQRWLCRDSIISREN